MTGLHLHMTKRRQVFSCILLDTSQLQSSRGFRTGPDLSMAVSQHHRSTTRPVAEQAQPSLLPKPGAIEATKLSGSGTKVLFRLPYDSRQLDTSRGR